MSEDVWTIRRVLEWTKGHFERQSVDAPRLTSELLLAHTLKVNRVTLYVDLDRPLQKEELTTFKALIQRRITGEPTQYLIGSKEFYGRSFDVDPRVLIPRPETELLVAAALGELPKDRPSSVLDLCTGSGCVAITVAIERPQAKVWATDISPDALAVARANAQRLGVAERVTFLEGDLFAALPAETRFDVITANPPYVKSSEISGLQKEVLREPAIALDGGADGLTLIGRIATDAVARLVPGGLLVLEIGDDQGPAVEQVLLRAGTHAVRIEKDYARHDRLASGRAPGGTPRALSSEKPREETNG